MRYQQIFDEAIGETPPTTVDVDQVVRRQRRAARVRPALAAAATVLVAAAGITVAVQLTGGDGSSVPPLTETGPLAGFPEYAEGAQVVAAESAPMADRSLTLTFTPATRDLILFTRCDPEQYEDIPVILYAELTAGEATTGVSINAASNGYCTLPAAEAARADVADDLLSPEGGDGWDGWDEFWAAMAVDEPVTITVTLVDAAALFGGGQPSIPASGTFGLAVGERVPFEEYRLPPRPDPLRPLPQFEGEVLVRANPDDPNQRVEATVAWDASLAGCSDNIGYVYPLEMQSQTPGSLRVLVNDVEVAHHTWWDYAQGIAATRLDGLCGEVSDGDRVTIAAEPEHMTGGWQVGLNRSGG